ncbi:S-protein homolog 1 [Linum grandiflorum]
MFSSSSSTSQVRIITPIVMVVATILLSLISPSSADLYAIKYEAHIVNELSANKVLYVHCHCTDHDLGDHYINVGSEFVWSFKSHVLRMTRWKCYLAPDNNRHVDFVAFSTNMSHICFGERNTFYWVAKDDGIYMRDTLEFNLDHFSHPWDANS